MRHSSFIKFILQFIFLAKVARLILPTLVVVDSVNWLLPIVGSIVYIMIGVFLLQDGSLQVEYNIDTLSLIFFILFGTIFRIDRVEYTTYEAAFMVAEWLIAGLLLFRVVTRKIFVPPVKWGNIKWAAIGSIAGVLLALPLSYLFVHTTGFQTPPVDTDPYTVLLSILQGLFMNGRDAVTEEIIFRGLLFGYLAKHSGNEKQAFLIQFLLFWGFHFHYLWIPPFSFWFSVPISAFVFSMLFWRSRSLSSSIAAHILINTFMTIFSIIIVNSS